jgi:hypothetical protein
LLHAVSRFSTFPKETTMATSSIQGADQAPARPAGHDNDTLGPSDSSDSASDVLNAPQNRTTDSPLSSSTDAAGTGERSSAAPDAARDGRDIQPDRVSRPDRPQRGDRTGETESLGPDEGVDPDLLIDADDDGNPAGAQDRDEPGQP